MKTPIELERLSVFPDIHTQYDETLNTQKSNFVHFALWFCKRYGENRN